MKILCFVSLAFSSLGCAHLTPHEQCSKPDTLARYKDYDQCHEQLAKADEIKKLKRFNCVTSRSGSMSNTRCR